MNILDESIKYFYIRFYLYQYARQRKDSPLFLVRATFQTGLDTEAKHLLLSVYHLSNKNNKNKIDFIIKSRVRESSMGEAPVHLVCRAAD